MAGPNYGALGATFKSARILQTVSLIAIIGMTANFIQQMNSRNETPHNVLIGTLVVTCISVLYCAITIILMADNILPFFLNAIMDTLLLIAVIVVAVTVGKPLSYLNCQVIGSADVSESAYSFTMALGSSLKDGGNLDYFSWAGTSKSTCLEMKAIWGLSIALCILFAFSSICSICLWRRKPALAPKDIEG